MEVWALEGFGVAHILQEILTYKSDHLIARQEILNATIWEKECLITRIRQNLFECSFENYDLWL
jgi:DNA-directed RNA polymerase beta subunit